MANPSQAERKKRNNSNLRGQLLLAESKNARLSKLALDSHAQQQHLARLIIGVVAVLGHGVITIPAVYFARIPASARLQETYDKETNEITMRTVFDDDEPAIEVVEPTIHLLPDDDVLEGGEPVA